jgi:hypothetical protein
MVDVDAIYWSGFRAVLVGHLRLPRKHRAIGAKPTGNEVDRTLPIRIKRIDESFWFLVLLLVSNGTPISLWMTTRVQVEQTYSFSCQDVRTIVPNNLLRVRAN